MDELHVELIKWQERALKLEFRVDNERAKLEDSRRNHYLSLQLHGQYKGTAPTLETYKKAPRGQKNVIKEQCDVICEFASRDDWHRFPGHFVIALRYFPGYLSTIVQDCTPEEFEKMFDSMKESGFFQLLNANVVQFNHQVWGRVISLMDAEDLLKRADDAGMNMIEALAKWGYIDILLRLFNSGKVKLPHLWNVAPNKTHSPFVSECMRMNDENVLDLVRTLAPQLEEMYGTDLFMKPFLPNGTSDGTGVVFRPNITVAGILATSNNFEALVHILLLHISCVLRVVTLVNKGFHDIARNRNLASPFSFRGLPTDVCKHIGKQCVATVGIGGNLRPVLEGMRDTSASAQKILAAMNSAGDLSAYYTLLKEMEL